MDPGVDGDAAVNGDAAVDGDAVDDISADPKYPYESALYSGVNNNDRCCSSIVG